MNTAPVSGAVCVMSIEKDIRIIDLLAQREAEFMKVHSLEEAVRAILGGAAFPFPAVQADLPSLHSRRKSSVAKQIEDNCAGEEQGMVLRRLHAPEENCYHIFYVDENGQNQESFQNDYELLEEILRLQNDEFRVTGIETVYFESMDQWHRVETVFATSGADQ